MQSILSLPPPPPPGSYLPQAVSKSRYYNLMRKTKHQILTIVESQIQTNTSHLILLNHLKTVMLLGIINVTRDSAS